MNHQRLATIEVGEEVFGAPPQPFDGSTLEPPGEIWGEGHAQVAAAGLHMRQLAVFQRRSQAHSHGFDFGQLRHQVTYRESQAQHILSLMPDTSSTASFGYRDVPEAEKENLVREVFSSVARRYDVMNDLMSAGVHRLWKDAMVEWVNPQPGQCVLDVAGGTGDIAFRIAGLARQRGGEADITVCDINEEMLTE